jgi:sulfatase modifying factor 1
MKIAPASPACLGLIAALVSGPAPGCETAQPGRPLPQVAPPAREGPRVLTSTAADLRAAAAPLLDMVAVPGGRFTMGGAARRGPRAALGADARRTVEVAPFLMSRTEVTQEQYEAVTGHNPSLYLGARLPVGRIGWYDAVRFANALSLREGLRPAYRLLDGRETPGERATREYVEWDRSADGYRLPTEAEWEWAAGDDAALTAAISPPGAACTAGGALDAVAWHCGNSAGKPQPVATRRANRHGLHDMLGNANEWVWDWFAPQTVPVEGVLRDPAGPASRPATGPFKTLKGGSYLLPPATLSASGRAGHVNFEYYWHHDFGIRLVRNAPAATAQRSSARSAPMPPERPLAARPAGA